MKYAKVQKLERPSRQCFEKHLGSGHSLLIREHSGHEILEIIAPTGQLAVEITLSETGPKVKVLGGSLAMHQLQKFSVSCEEFDVKAAKSAKIVTDGDFELATEQHLKITSKGDTRVNGERILLNCTEI